MTRVFGRRRATWLLLAGIVAVAAVVRFRGITFGLPHTQARPDETHVIETARALLRGTLESPFYDYPWLYMWGLTALYLGYYVWGAIAGTFHSIADLVASWPVHWEPFFLIARALSATLGTLTVVALYRLGSRTWGTATGLLAAFFLSLAFLHARDSHFGTTDVAMTLLIVWSVALLVDADRTGQTSTFAWAGMVGGLAAATKYNAVLLGVVPVVSYGLHIANTPAERRRDARDSRLLAFALPFAAAFAIGVPFAIFDTRRFLDSMQLLQGSMSVGSPSLHLGSGWLHHLQFSLRYGIGLPLLIAGIVGIVATLRWQPRLALLVWSFPITYYLVAGSIRNLFFRYAIPLVPFLCLAAARLVVRAVEQAEPAFAALAGARARQAQSAAVAAAAVLLVWPSARAVWQFDRIISQTDSRVLVARWFAENVPQGCSVLQAGSRYGLVQFQRDNGYTLWLWDGGMFRVNREPATGKPDWIVVPESPLPSSIQPIVSEFLKSDYMQVARFDAYTAAPSLVYDRQDAFFAPFAGFEYVERPGPNFTVYKRVNAPVRSAVARAW